MRNVFITSICALGWLAVPYTENARGAVIEPIYEKVLNGNAYLYNKDKSPEFHRVSIYRQFAKKDPLNIYFFSESANAMVPMYVLNLYSQTALAGMDLINSTLLKTTYLEWREKSMICLCRISGLTPNRCYADGFAVGFPSYWQADYFVDLSQYEDWEKHFAYTSNDCNITVTSVTPEKAGLTFTATNEIGTHFRFTKTRDGWLISGDTGPIRQVRTNTLDMSIFRFGETYSIFTNTLSFKSPEGKTKDVEATLIATVRRLESNGMRYYLYQLVETTNQAVALSRPVWSIMLGGNLGRCACLVKTNDGGVYYLCFTDGNDQLCVSAIPEVLPVGGFVADPTVGPLSQPKDDSFIRGGADYIIDLRQFNHYERFFKGGGGVASANLQDNVLTLTVTNAAGSKFKFSNQDGQWHAYSFWGEINQRK